MAQSFAIRLSRKQRLIQAIIILVAIVAVLAGAATTLYRNTRPVSAVTPLVMDSFTTNATTPNAWTSGGSGGGVACLTARAGTGTGTSIPGCAPTASDGNGSGALRLTSASAGRTGFALLNTAINASDGLDIKFSIHQYGGQGWGAASPAGSGSPEARPGDGLSFFLIDGAASPTQPGPDSGSLGYANDQDRGLAGIVGGYVGVGFDRFGNNSWDKIGTNGPMSTLHDINYANSVVVRGGATSNYRYVAGHRAGCGDGYAQGTPTCGGSQQSLSGTTRTNSERQVHITVSTSNIMTVRVSYDQGATWVTEFSNVNLNTINGTGSFPSSFKLGFAASTGGAYQVHEIRSLNITTLPPDVSATATPPGTFTRGGTAVFTATASNSAAAGSTDETVTMTTTFPAGITPTAAAGTGWSCGIAGQVVTCTRASGIDNNEVAPAVSITTNVAMNVAVASSVTTVVNVTDDSNSANNTHTLNLNIPNLIVANNDAYGPIPVSGGTIGNVLANDTINGVAVVPAAVTISTASPYDNPHGITINSNGQLIVPGGLVPNTPYIVPYQVCEVAAPTNCANATATISTHKAIVATNKSFSATQAANSNVGNVLTGSTLDGSAATTGNVTITYDAGTTGITVNTGTGAVAVPADLAPGPYVIEYTICETAQPANCSVANITVNVTATPIVATTDDFSATPVPYGGGTTASVLGNDTLNGAQATTSNVTVEVVNANSTGITVNTDGTLVVPAATPGGLRPGLHTIQYRICETAHPSNCSAPADATVAVAVLPIVTNQNTLTSVNGRSGSTDAGSVLTGDTLGGSAITAGDVTVTGVGLPSWATIDATTGVVSVAAGTPAGGPHTLNYQVCEVLEPTNCQSGTSRITITAAPVTIAPVALGSVNGRDGATNAGNVLTGATLGGAPINPADVTVTAPSGTPAGITINSDGTVTVAAGTPAGGPHTIQYRVCEVLNPTNCQTNEVTVTVTAAPIVANPVTISPIDGRDGTANGGSVLTGNTLNGNPINPADVTVTTPNGTPSGISIGSNGVISVAAGTPAGGPHVIEYRICEVLNPTNCQTEEVTITITAAPIVASTNTIGPINGYDGQSGAGNVLTGNTIGGDPIDPSDVTVTTPSGTPTGITVGSNGSVSVAPGTPAGSHTVSYRVCEAINPGNCVDGTTTVVVTAAAFSNTPSVVGPVNGRDGATNAGSVLTGNTLNGNPIDPDEVAVTVVGTPPTGISINGNGVVTVAPGTPAGSYPITYRVCEVLNPTNCFDQTVTVTVTAAPLTVTPDTSPDPVVSGGAVNILDGGTLGGNPIDPSDVTVTVTNNGGLTGVTINPDGTLTVPDNTPAGTYPVEYRVCEVLNPTNCQTGTITVEVEAPVVSAHDDTTFAAVNGAHGRANAGDVLANDRINGQPINPADVTITLVGALPPELTFDTATGVVGVRAGTPAGSYSFRYQVCQNANPTACSTSQVVLAVTLDEVAVTPVKQNPIGTDGGVAGNVFDGATINGVGTNKGNLFAEIADNGGLKGVTIDNDGNVIVPSGAAPGTYTVAYRVCMVDQPTNCTEGTMTITVDEDKNEGLLGLLAPNTGFYAAAANYAGVIMAVILMLTGGGVALRVVKRRR